jgi:hypothetical protein
VGFGAIKLLHQLKVRRLLRVMVLESEGFETTKICDHYQSVLHIFAAALNRTGQPCGGTRPDFKLAHVGTMRLSKSRIRPFSDLFVLLVPVR